MKEIQLTGKRGGVAIVDDEDYERLMQWRWMHSNHGYAVYGSGKNLILMHRVILQTPKGMDTDHIDGDTLNNVRSNLRVCRRKENLWNKAPHRTRNGKPCSSKYKGVFWQANCNKWCARIRANGNRITCGYFADEIEAAKAYDAKARELHGEFARLNFPPEQ